MKKILWLALPTVLLAIVVHNCYLSPEAQVKRAVKAALVAVERQDVDQVMAFFHPAFSDSLGFAADQWRLLLDYSWQRYKDVDVTLIQPTITVDGDMAKMTFHARVDATLAASLREDAQPVRPSAYRQNVDITLKKDGAAWKLLDIGDITAAEWGIPVDKALE